jgi:hypothetical protein
VERISKVVAEDDIEYHVNDSQYVEIYFLSLLRLPFTTRSNSRKIIKYMNTNLKNHLLRIFAYTSATSLRLH